MSLILIMNYEDFEKCITNKTWRINNLYKIVDKKSNLITFKQNHIQKLIHDCDSKRKIILKARQFGITTNAVIDIFDETIFSRNVTNCIIAHEADAIKKIFRIAKHAYKTLPNDIKPTIDRGGGSKYEMYFPEINSLIYCDLESRGDTINNLHVSEIGFMKKERLDATLQAVPKDGKVTIEGTANGMESFFYDIWMDQDSIYKHLFFPWFFHHEYFINKNNKPLKLTLEEKQFIKNCKKIYNINISYDQIRYRRFKQNELKDVFLQEYPEDDISCFLFSGRSVCDQSTIRELKNSCRQVLEVIGETSIFQRIVSGYNYVIGADCAQGIGGDFSVASVVCLETSEEVAFMRGNYSPFDFANKLNWLASLYTTCFRFPLIAIENNNHGHAVLLQLIENLKYPNVFYHQPERPGWRTDSVTRPIMLNQFIDSVQNSHLKINSKITLNEMITLVNKNGKIQAISNKNDDAVFATAIANQMLIRHTDKVRLYQNIKKSIFI